MSEDTRRNDIIDELGRLSDHHQYVDSLRSLNFLSFKSLVSEKAIGLMTAINNFLTISTLYLKANYMKKVTIGVIGEDKVEVSKLALRAAAQEFNEAVEHESHFIIWKEEEARRTAKALDSLTKLNYKVIHSGYRKVLAEGSGKWFLEAPKFQKWLKGEQRCLWCPGLREQPFLYWEVVLTTPSWCWKDHIDVSSKSAITAYLALYFFAGITSDKCNLDPLWLIELLLSARLIITTRRWWG
jgi:hypothetical protein